MELIDKQAVIDAIVSGTIYETAEAIKKECQNPSSDNDWIGGINEAIKTIEDIDSIEIVRCKDCKHWFPGCELLHKPMDKDDNWYCGDGERK